MEGRRERAARQHAVDFVLADAGVAQGSPGRISSKQERASSWNATDRRQSRADDDGFRAKSLMTLRRHDRAASLLHDPWRHPGPSARGSWQERPLRWNMAA